MSDYGTGSRQERISHTFLASVFLEDLEDEEDLEDKEKKGKTPLDYIPTFDAILWELARSEDITAFLDAIRTIRSTTLRRSERTRGKIDSRSYDKLEKALLTAILTHPDEWQMRIWRWTRELLKMRTEFEDGARLFVHALRMSAVASSETLLEVPAELNIAVRQYLYEEREALKDKYSAIWLSKVGMQASTDDNDTGELLEPEIPHDSPDAGDAQFSYDWTRPDALDTFELNKKTTKSFLDAFKSVPGFLLRVCRHWCRILRDYFTQAIQPETTQKQSACLKAAAVDVLVAMKIAPPSDVARSEEWRDALVASGLAELMQKLDSDDFFAVWGLDVKKLGVAMRIELMRASCVHQWREQFKAIWQEWTPKSAAGLSPLAAPPNTGKTLLEHYNDPKNASDSTAKVGYLRVKNKRLNREHSFRQQAKRREAEKKAAKAAKNTTTRPLAFKPSPYKTYRELTWGEALYVFLSDHPEALPSRFNMQFTYFLLDLANFLRNYEEWMRAVLREYGLYIPDEQVVDTYNQLMQLDKKDVELGLAPRLELTLRLSRELRKRRSTYVKKGKVTLKDLKSMPEVKIHPVTKMADGRLELVERNGFSVHPPEAQLQPKRPKPPASTAANTPTNTFTPTIYDPVKFGLIKIDQRVDILEKYHRDVHILVEEGTEKIVAGIIYKAYQVVALREALKHHALVSLHPGLQRGSNFAPFAVGDMVGSGFRKASGGARGEGAKGPQGMLRSNAEKSEMDGGNHDVEMMFAHTQDVEEMFITVQKYAPEVARDIQHVSDVKGGDKSMGFNGASAYYCTNYVSPQHKDKDKGWSLCSQISKDLAAAGGNPETDFNFALTHWGRYFVTRPNSVWWFHSNEMHGTIMPAQSTIDRLRELVKIERQAVRRTLRLRGGAGILAGLLPDRDNTPGSVGVHVTNRRRDVARATHYAEVQQATRTRHAYWQGRISRAREGQTA
ncbi:unnamed protein product [Peniophora sp. CBMAI 1063]|nr:unnamed protein product [Peniophora sp. CBMAI 1063]